MAGTSKRDPQQILKDLNTLGFLGRAQPERIKDMILKAAEFLEQADELREFLPLLAEAIENERNPG